jgi:hypothetical protein
VKIMSPFVSQTANLMSVSAGILLCGVGLCGCRRFSGAMCSVSVWSPCRGKRSL